MACVISLCGEGRREVNGTQGNKWKNEEKSEMGKRRGVRRANEGMGKGELDRRNHKARIQNTHKHERGEKRARNHLP